MSNVNSTRRIDEPPPRDGAPLAGWPTTITAEEAAALRGALGQFQTALDAVVRDRDEARAASVCISPAVARQLRDALDGALADLTLAEVAVANMEASHANP